MSIDVRTLIHLVLALVCVVQAGREFPSPSHGGSPGGFTGMWACLVMATVWLATAP